MTEAPLSGLLTAILPDPALRGVVERAAQGRVGKDGGEESGQWRFGHDPSLRATPDRFPIPAGRA
ncbi:hypothetical protein, partial [Amycolatopsis lexingtonensis]|uniref:hypothetical protein n=1 Tax=Amycolatopsis lexingtonensis TaxID=218822 RepID=UPI001B8085C2